jgi:hypothetical protein
MQPTYETVEVSSFSRAGFARLKDLLYFSMRKQQILRFSTPTSQQRACWGPWLAQDDTSRKIRRFF